MARYTGIVEAVLAAKDHEDGDDHHQVPHLCLPHIHALLFELVLLLESAQHEGSMHHQNISIVNRSINQKSPSFVNLHVNHITTNQLPPQRTPSIRNVSLVFL